jgi:DHA1 family bicyclomycin/chloramphenicol resistance-like MFS transporter
MNAGTATGAGAPSRLFLAVLVLATSLGPFAMQIFVPALPVIQADFGSPVAVTQLALSLSMISIAVFTLFYGPLADAYGRRPVLLAGIGMYLGGTALCIVAPDIEWLIVGRIFQAAGGASGIVISRAIVRDLYPTDKVASTIAYLTIAMVVSPMIAPVIGGIVIDLVGWRMNFILVGVLGILVIGGVAAALTETHHERKPISRAADLVGGFGPLMRSPRFCGYVFQGAFSSGIFFSFLAGVPYIMIDVLERPATEYGIGFFLLAFSFMVGNFIAART